jgi:hypothetical protein
MQAETQINNISVIFPATPEKFTQYYGHLERLNYFTFAIWIDRTASEGEMCKRRARTTADPF